MKILSLISQYLNPNKQQNKNAPTQTIKTMHLINMVSLHLFLLAIIFALVRLIMSK